MPETATTPLAWLDELDRLRAAATPGPWEHIRDHHQDDLVEHSIWAGQYIVEQIHDADAALIVAAVNAVPRLTAAVRAVLTYCDEIDRAKVFPGLADTGAIRSRLAAALTEPGA